MLKTDELTPAYENKNRKGDTRFMYHDVYLDPTSQKAFFETWKVTDLKFDPSEGDTYHTVESGEEGLRGITLLSYRYYQRVDLWWIIAAVNGIFVPSAELKAGMQLRIPALSSILSQIG